MSLTPQQAGFKFEDKIHRLLSQTKFSVLREKDIVQIYGIIFKGIDHLVYTDNYIICLQDKWMITSPTLSKINHFITCTNNIGFSVGCRCIGIYLSKKQLTGPALQAFEFENTKNINHYTNLYDEDENIILDKLTRLLYENSINLYEEDGSLIML